MSDRLQIWLSLAAVVFVTWLLVHFHNDQEHARSDIVSDVCAAHGGYKENLRDPEAYNPDKYFHILCEDGMAFEGSFDRPDHASRYIYDDV